MLPINGTTYRNFLATTSIFFPTWNLRIFFLSFTDLYRIQWINLTGTQVQTSWVQWIIKLDTYLERYKQRNKFCTQRSQFRKYYILDSTLQDKFYILNLFFFLPKISCLTHITWVFHHSMKLLKIVIMSSGGLWGGGKGEEKAEWKDCEHFFLPLRTRLYVCFPKYSKWV